MFCDFKISLKFRASYTHNYSGNWKKGCCYKIWRSFNWILYRGLHILSFMGLAAVAGLFRSDIWNTLRYWTHFNIFLQRIGISKNCIINTIISEDKQSPAKRFYKAGRERDDTRSSLEGCMDGDEFSLWMEMFRYRNLFYTAACGYD